jgi:hypothetical protein
MNHGTIRVTEEAKTTIDASSVKLHIAIEGDNFIFGNAAIEKCSDVKTAVVKIQSIDENATISVDAVLIRSDTGWFTKATKGSYKLTVRLLDLAKINDMLGALMELKNVSLESIEWEYKDFNEKIAMSKEAARKCQDKAEAVITGLGKRLIGIHSCSDSYELSEDDGIHNPCGGSSISSERKTFRRAVASPVDFGTSVRGKKDITAVFTIEYYIDNKELA